MAKSEPENILYKYTEKLAKQRARRIDNAFKKVVPLWQQKVLLKTKSKLIGKLFGWEIRTYLQSDKFEIWNRRNKYFSHK
jgi:hypothetical protein